MTRTALTPPGAHGRWAGPLEELERVTWRAGDAGDPGELLDGFLHEHGLGGDPRAQDGDHGVVLLLGADACAAVAGLPLGPPTPAPGVPDLVAVAVRPGTAETGAPVGRTGVGDWSRTWTAAAHADAVRLVQEAIGRGDVYQANVVGHRSAPVTGDPALVASVVAALPGAAYAGVLAGAGWAVGSASPEQLLRLDGDRLTTVPVKGTGHDAGTLRASGKDRAEHVMIVDLERNDLARVAVTGSVEVEELYRVDPWADLVHASSTVAARLREGVGLVEVLAALGPGGSVTGAPKRSAWELVGRLEPVGRGPAMGAFGLVQPGRADLGLTIRTVAVADGRVHLWAGGGVTWGSDPSAEVAEAEAKAAPVLRALAAR